MKQEGIQEKECPKCLGVMWWEDNGESKSIDGGNLNQQDNGGYWRCLNQDCRFIEDPETTHELELVWC